jgi:hypothetical protein
MQEITQPFGASGRLCGREQIRAEFTSEQPMGAVAQLQDRLHGAQNGADQALIQAGIQPPEQRLEKRG